MAIANEVTLSEVISVYDQMKGFEVDGPFTLTLKYTGSPLYKKGGA